MFDFNSGAIDILVATPVVEVGIDNPNANIMMIEDAKQFGLSQLHQLRGRVGRGKNQAYCLLMSTEKTARLSAMETNTDGLVLAEMDLEIRGTGNIFGLNQHGALGLKIAEYKDLSKLTEAKMLALTYLKDPSKYPLLNKLIEKAKIETIAPN